MRSVLAPRLVPMATSRIKKMTSNLQHLFMNKILIKCTYKQTQTFKHSSSSRSWDRYNMHNQYKLGPKRMLAIGTASSRASRQHYAKGKEHSRLEWHLNHNIFNMNFNKMQHTNVPNPHKLLFHICKREEKIVYTT